MVSPIVKIDLLHKTCTANVQKAGLSVGIPSCDFPSWEPASAASANIQIGLFFSDIAPNSRSCARDRTYTKKIDNKNNFKKLSFF